MSNEIYLYGKELAAAEKVKIRKDERSKAIIEKTPILVRKIGQNTWYLNTATGQKGATYQSVYDEKYAPYMLYELEKAKKELIGVKPMYDEKQQKLCFVYFNMPTERIFQKPFRTSWEEYCRVYIHTDAEKRNTVIRNNYYYFESNCGYRHSEDYEFRTLPLNWKTLNNVDKPDKYFLVDYPGIMGDRNEIWNWNWKDALTPIREKFGNIVPVAGNKMVSLDNIYGFMHFMNAKIPAARTELKTQKRLDELVSHKLLDVEITENLCNEKSAFSYKVNIDVKAEGDLQRFAVIQKVPDMEEPMCVLRTYFYSQSLNSIKEGGRIYIGKKEIVPSRVDVDGNFIYQSLLSTPVHWSFPILNFNKDAAKGTKLEYYSEVMDEIEPIYRGLVVWAFLKWPITEAMYKMDIFKPYMQMVFKMCGMKSPMDILKMTFGNIDTSSKNVYKALGLNKQQVELLMPDIMTYIPKINEYGAFVTRGFVSYVKLALTAETREDFAELNLWVNMVPKVKKDISAFDIESVKEIADAILKAGSYYAKQYKAFDICGMAWNVANYNIGSQMAYEFETMSKCLAKTRLVYSLPVAKKMIPALVELGANTIKYSRPTPYGMSTAHASGYTLYYDYLCNVELLDMATDLKPYFKTEEQLVNMHDLTSELYTLKKSEIDRNIWKQRAEKANWQKWEFSDEEFITVAPKEPEELTKEGIALHHCVGGYIKRVSEGITNIMFIRKKAEPQIPFFTVEIINDGTIEQVHGLFNCNADSYPGLPEFVNSWVKNKKLKIRTYNKVR